MGGLAADIMLDIHAVIGQNFIEIFSYDPNPHSRRPR
jgi:hypothetical protein